MTNRAPTAGPSTPTEPGPVPAAPQRVRPGAVLALAVTLVLGYLVVGISYSMAREYGDTAASDVTVAVTALRWWAVGIVLVAGSAVLTRWASRRSRGRRVLGGAAAVALVLTLLGVPAAAVVGVHRKLEAYPSTPRCTVGFTSGPALPVVRAAERSFAAIEHPGPFSGGGESGIAGCESQLMVTDDVDVVGEYLVALPAAGWRVTRVEPDRVEATRAGHRFTAIRREGRWSVRIEPAGAVR